MRLSAVVKQSKYSLKRREGREQGRGGREGGSRVKVKSELTCCRRQMAKLEACEGQRRGLVDR